MSAEASSLPVGSQVGEYEVTGVLGKGGMGTVYAGVHPVIGKEVAIKVLNPEMASNPSVVSRFVQEARSVNQIRHPNIIDIFAFGELPEGQGNYFVMERLPGMPLADYLDTNGPMSFELALDILEQTADALEAAHEKGITHRDLKPDNLFLVEQRKGGFTVKVLDFGIAKLTDGSAMVKTKTGLPMGTPLFMPPEQWKGEDVDQRADVYAMGVMCHYMLTGRYPFGADSYANMMYAHLNEPPIPPSAHGAPPQVDIPVRQALEKNADRRFVSPVSFVRALRHAFAEHAALPTTSADDAAPPAAEAAEVPRGTKRSLLLLVAAAAVVAAGAIVYVVALRGGASSTEASADFAAGDAAVVEQTASTPPTDAAPPGSPSTEATAAEPARFGELVLVNRYSNARVTLDGNPVALTGRTTKLSEVLPGDHVVSASAPRRVPREFTVTVTEGRSEVLTIKLARARASSPEGSNEDPGDDRKVKATDEKPRPPGKDKIDF